MKRYDFHPESFFGLIAVVLVNVKLAPGRVVEIAVASIVVSSVVALLVIPVSFLTSFDNCFVDIFLANFDANDPGYVLSLLGTGGIRLPDTFLFVMS